jgi:glyoxylase-like metal-dependent hydrolase (beta-lactamase superfamily II)
MVTEVVKDIYKIDVPLPDNPLRVLNSYFIRGRDSDMLIDTGFRRPECEEALREGLEELGWDRSRLDVMTTHFHADHSGLVRIFAGDDRKIYFSDRDYDGLDRYLHGTDSGDRTSRYLLEGFPPELSKEIKWQNPATSFSVDVWDDRFTRYKEGDKFEVGDYVIEAIDVRGHTPGNMMLWIEKEGIMFTGDHVLFDISPNITHWHVVEDSLGDYLDSLEKAKKYPVKLALPGHRESGDYHARIDALIEHHQKRLNEVLRLIGENPGINAYDLTGLMRWKIRAKNWDDFPPVQKWFAVGECLSHLDYLRLRGKIEMMVDEDGFVTYKTK